MSYQDLIVSGKSASQTIASGESGANIIVRNSAVLRLGAGGYISNTTVYNNAKLSNCGVADSTFLSGGTMYVSNGGVANGVRVLREAIHAGQRSHFKLAGFDESKYPARL